MNSTAQVKIDKNTRVLVSAGEEITPQKILAQRQAGDSLEIIDLSRLTGIPPVKISKYLQIGTGQEVSEGQIILEKKNLFNTITAISPFSGIIKQIDLKAGHLTISVRNANSHKNISYPVAGKVKSVTQEQILIEIQGKVYLGIKGEGNNCFGKLYYYPGGRLGVLDKLRDAPGSIICCDTVNDDTIIKLDVLGFMGMIVNILPRYSSISYIQVDEETLKSLSVEDNKNIYILPEERQIIVPDD